MLSLTYSFAVARVFAEQREAMHASVRAGLNLWAATELVSFSHAFYEPSDPDLHIHFYFGDDLTGNPDAQTMQRLWRGEGGAVVQFNVKRRWGLWTGWRSIFELWAEANLCQTTAHEVGHCLGLDHPELGVASIETKGGALVGEDIGDPFIPGISEG